MYLNFFIIIKYVKCKTIKWVLVDEPLDFLRVNIVVINAQFLLKLQVKYYLTLITLNILTPPCLILNPKTKQNFGTIQNIFVNTQRLEIFVVLTSCLPSLKFHLALI